MMYWHDANHLTYIMPFNSEGSPKGSVFSHPRFMEVKWSRWAVTWPRSQAQEQPGFAAESP